MITVPLTENTSLCAHKFILLHCRERAWCPRGEHLIDVGGVVHEITAGAIAGLHHHAATATPHQREGPAKWR